MITVEGAKLLAQFIPVLVLILAVERRILGPEPEPLRLVGWLWYWIKGIGQTFGAGVALVSMGPLIVHVNANQNIDGIWAVVIIVSVVLAGQAVIAIVTDLVFRGYFGHTRIDRGEERIRLKAEEAYDARRSRHARRLAHRRIAQRKVARVIAPVRDGGLASVQVGKPPAATSIGDDRGQL